MNGTLYVFVFLRADVASTCSRCRCIVYVYRMPRYVAGVDIAESVDRVWPCCAVCQKKMLLVYASTPQTISNAHINLSRDKLHINLTLTLTLSINLSRDKGIYPPYLYSYPHPYP